MSVQLKVMENAIFAPPPATQENIGGFETSGLSFDAHISQTFVGQTWTNAMLKT